MKKFFEKPLVQNTKNSGKIQYFRLKLNLQKVLIILIKKFK
jgi:hypothetical protein